MIMVGKGLNNNHANICYFSSIVITAEHQRPETDVSEQRAASQTDWNEGGSLAQDLRADCEATVPVSHGSSWPHPTDRLHGQMIISLGQCRTR